jgi:hypothetical protein
LRDASGERFILILQEAAEYQRQRRHSNGAATAFENFLLGRPQQVFFALGDPRINTRQDDFFFFVQDDRRL